MPSAFTHAAAALALGTAFQRPGPPARLWVAGALCAVVPDLDVIGFRFGIPYDDVLGHRGLSHSLAGAAVLATLVVLAAFRSPEWAPRRGRIWAFLFLATASHGLLDMLTDGGGGVALLAPIENGRYFFPWQPVEVSPIGVRRFFTQRGVDVLKSELVWIWAPATLFAVACTFLRRRSHSPTST